MKRHLRWLPLLLLCLLLALMSLPAAALEASTVELVVDANAELAEGETYPTIQQAIDYIAAVQTAAGADDGTQWRVTVKAGTYDRFDVPLRTKNITIMGESREGTVVRVLQEEDESFWGTGYDSGGITLRGTNITLKNLTIQAGTRQMNGFTAAVGVHDGNVGGRAFSPTIENCTLTGSGSGDAFLFDCPTFVVAGCTITGFLQAIEFYGDNFSAADCAICNNVIYDCIYAVHGYYGGASADGYMEISGNTITGADDQFAVIAILDQNNTGAVRLSLEGNTFSRTIVGATNMRKDGDVKQGSMEDLQDVNTFADYSFIVDAFWYAADDYGSVFIDPIRHENKIAVWYADPTTENGYFTTEEAQEALEQFGTAGQFIEINAPLQEIFTLVKNAIVVKEYCDAYDLTVEKQVVNSSETAPSFAFTLSFTKKDGSPLNGRYDYRITDANGKTVDKGKAVLKAGAFNVSLKNGQRVIVEDLLPGTRYTVEEKLTEAQTEIYRSSIAVNGEPVEAAAGTIDGHTSVCFTNLGPDGVTLQVRKEWVGDDPSSRPDSVFVTLYGNGEPVGEPVCLSDDNGWSYTWCDLDNTVRWTVDELDVPEGYEKTIKAEKDGFVIVNMAIFDTSSDTEESDVPSSSEVPSESSEDISSGTSSQTPPTGDAGIAGAVLLLAAALSVFCLRARRQY